MTPRSLPDDPSWPMLDQAISDIDPTLLVQALKSERRHPALDHPICREERFQSRRRDMTAHARALFLLFDSLSASYDGGAQAHDVCERAERAALVCHQLMQANAKAFTAGIGSFMEDDHTFVITTFVQSTWPPAAEQVIAQLFDAYVASGYIDVNATLDIHDGIIGGLLPVDAAIKMGNGSAAAALIRNRCDMSGVAADRLGKAIDLADYVRARARSNPLEVAAKVMQAMMERWVEESPSAARIADASDETGAIAPLQPRALKRMPGGALRGRCL